MVDYARFLDAAQILDGHSSQSKVRPAASAPEEA
jgi:hypothetical protein